MAILEKVDAAPIFRTEVSVESMKRLQIGAVLIVGLASTAGGSFGCAAEDAPDAEDASTLDVTRDTSRNDISVGPDSTNDTSADARDVSADTRDAGADTRTDSRVDSGDAPGCVPPSFPPVRDAAAGLALVQSLNCVRCHQDQPVDAGIILSGRTTSSVADAGVYARNLTPDLATGLGCWTNEEIADAILSGVDRDGKQLCRMPAFAARIDGGGVDDLINFLRSRDPVAKAIPPTDPVGPPSPPPAAGGADVRDAGNDGVSDVATDGDGGAPDAEPDAIAPDAAPDATLPDATPDVAPDTAPDGGSDATPPDAAPDATSDADDAAG